MPDFSGPGGLRLGRYRYLPVVPGRMEFAALVREQILENPPEVVAVELPKTMEESYRKAVARLPELSAILYEDSVANRAVYLPVEITDPMVEAVRTAEERGLKISFVDPDLGYQPPKLDSCPDSYAVSRIGYAAYCSAFRKIPRSAPFQLRRHAAGIAWSLQNAEPGAEVLVVLSLNLLDLVLEAMETEQSVPLARARRKDVRVCNLHPECLGEVLIEFPFLQSCYEARRQGTPEADPPGSTQTVQEIGGFQVISNTRETREQQLGAAVRRTARRVGQTARRVDLDRAPTETAGEPSSVEAPRSATLPTVMDRQRLNFQLLREAERCYVQNTGEKLHSWQHHLMARYLRNLSLLDHRLVSGLFDLTVAARSVADDNFAWELWDLATASHHQKVDTDLITINISGEEIWWGTRKLRLRRRLPRHKRQRPAGLKGRKRESVPGEWAREFDGSSICSYPPEDIVLEGYSAFLMKKGKSILSEERARVEPFTTSLLDGIDMRETIRNWHKKQLYVREYQQISGEVGSVVIIFDADQENRYSWCKSWLGEHTQESDMAFYSTNPFDNIVGPGIGRAEYGGFLLTYPPRRLVDVWSDPDYWFAGSKSERLLLAALDYSLQQFVVYLAAKPPRSIFKSLAARMGRKIIYLPIGQVSPLSLKKIRILHVLDGHERRETAKDYIW